MELALADMPLAAGLVALLLAASGILLYAAPERRFRTLGQVGLSLGWAVATVRYLGLAPGFAVGVLGLALTWLLDGGDEPATEQLGAPMRLLLALFALIAAAALVVGRPLGDPTAIDANAAWYWSAALGLLILLSEPGARSAARSGALVVAGAGIAYLHLAPGPPVALPLASALLVLGLGAATRWRGVRPPLAAHRAALLVDALLAAGALGIVIALAERTLVIGTTTFTLTGAYLPTAAAAALLGAGVAGHARLAGSPGAVLTSWSVLAAATVSVAAIASTSPPVAGVLAAIVPVLIVLGDDRTRLGRGGAALLIIGSVSGTCAVALGFVELSQSGDPQPGLARIGLAMALAHLSLLGALAPLHLWALGVIGGRSEHSGERTGGVAGTLAATLGLGSLASLGLFAGATRDYEWLLALTGARPLVIAIAVLGMVVAGVALLAEERIGRLVLQLGALAGGIALLAVASGDPRGMPSATELLGHRGVALALALIGADALLRWGPGRGTSPARRILRLDAVPLWVGLGGLIGLPSAARLSALAAIAAERPELAVLVLCMALVGLVGVKRIADAIVAAASEAEEPDERPPPLRRVVPLVLSGLACVYWLA